MEINIELIDFIPGPDDEAVTELADSIEATGLLHPITVQELIDSDRFKLVAGRKRLQAATLLNLTHIPVKILPSDLTPEKLKEISLEENLKRDNIQWYDLVGLRKELHDLRTTQHGEAKKGRPKKDGDKGWSYKDTAEELKISYGQFSEDLMLADALAINPNLKKVKDRTTAIRLVREETKRRISEVEASMPTEFDMNQVFLGDSLEVLKNIPDATFDLCITDPPWTEYKDDYLTADDSTFKVFNEVFRVMKQTSFLYLICSTTDWFTYQQYLTKLGFSVQKYPIMWVKGGTITHGRRSWEYARDYEPILVAVKGSPALVTTTEQSAILSYPSMHYQRMIHPHEKPIELLEKLIQDSSYEGACILDPFSGSGVTLEAARKLHRRYIGIERDRNFYNNIVKRLGETK